MRVACRENDGNHENDESDEDNSDSYNMELIREIPPGLLQHVLTVLVFWSWVLLLPRLPPWSRSLG